MISGLLLSITAPAQQTEVNTLTKYTQNQGLSSYNIREIIQDKFGYIWIATQDGLNRFDGQSFICYNKNLTSKRRLTGTDIRKLAEDRSRNFIWVLTDQGIDRINTITSNVEPEFSSRNPINEEWNVTTAALGNELWIGTFTGLRVYNTETRKSIVIPNRAGKNISCEIRTIFADAANNVWVCVTGLGIKIFDGKSKKLIKLIPNSILATKKKDSDIIYWNAIALKKHSYLLATNAGLRVLSYDQNYNISINNAPAKTLSLLNTENVQYVSKNEKGQVYVASHTGLYRFDNTFSSFTKLEDQAGAEKSEWLDAVFCSFSDQQNNLWLGCQDGLAFINRNATPFRSFYNDEVSGLKLEHVLSLSSPGKGTVFAGLRNGFVQVQTASGRFSLISKNQSFQHNYTDPFGLLQSSYPGGTAVFLKKKWSPIADVYPEFKAFSNYAINSHLCVGDSLNIMGTENDKGVLIWNYKKQTVKVIDQISRPALAANIVNTVYRDKMKNIWVLSDKKITILDSSLSRSKILSFYDSQNKQAYNIYFDMCEAGNNYWVAAYGTGIIQLGTDYKIRNIYTTKNGLSNAGIYKIFNVGDSSLVITSNNGISILNLNTRKFKNYYQQDGLHSNSFEEACGFMKDGIIYAGGVKGFTIIDPSKFRINTIAPRVYINRISMETGRRSFDTSSIRIKRLIVPNDVIQTSLYFSGINYSSPNHTTFAYRIDKQSENWINIGNRNFINLIGIPPGKYLIQLKAANEDNYWSIPTEISLIFLPKWYQTWWFKALIGFTIACLGYLFYRLRLRQILKEHSIRAGIAGDLHDDIGSSLNTIKVFTNLAIIKPEKVEYLDNINANLEAAIIGLRDLIWVLDDKKDTLEDLVNRLRESMQPVANAINIVLEIVVDESCVGLILQKTEKRYLYLIAKEAVNNSIKYAECTRINIKFKIRQKRLLVQITDNGNGFDPSGTNMGYGLKNMRTRCVHINYQFFIHSSSTGTQITLEKNSPVFSKRK
ncbi:histidine kinase/DNA gyrase B/HSP90-like ATPase [Mucilaginibacter oryzae]|uniref:histidine kinase n=1 Tax=Mucilaginibacter oryzae TaxID=468058 RepID=A0A316HG25_9SPHI|nr:histidine kinase/DNA gyrase B/HSP90-like ATPase [Mucilaginibacter oryzae]